MKYMKLGTKQDIFQAEENIRTVSTELESDVTLQVEDTIFYLHKFPLLSKCGRLPRLIVEAGTDNIIRIQDFEGGIQAFEICAKFCYGIAVTLNAYNVMNVRCAAEYLGMTENIDKGNLIFKLEVFLNSSIFKSWKDSIIALKATTALLPYSEDLNLVSRCIYAITSKITVDPSKVEWSFTYMRAKRASMVTLDETSNSPPWNGDGGRLNIPEDWWVEDISELDIDFYQRVMVAIQLHRRMSHQLIGEALTVYACRWLPGVSKDQKSLVSSKHSNVQASDKHKFILETTVSLLPPEKGSCSCSFLLRLLKAATILGVDASCKNKLAKRIGLQLDEALLSDLLIPSLSYVNDTLYDIDLVQEILDHFTAQDGSPHSLIKVHKENYEKRRSQSVDQLDFLENHTSVSHASKVRVAKLIDGYLTEIARDPNLPLAKFIALAESVSDSARPVHDGLYRAIDIYLKEHPGLSKKERKRICKLLDCKKLSMDACMHAAQNERLPLRVIVQVLFFEQVRTAMTSGIVLNDIPSSIKTLLPLTTESSDEQQEECNLQAGSSICDWESVHNDFNALKGGLAELKRKIDEAERERSREFVKEGERVIMKPHKARGLFSNYRRFLSRLLSTRNSSTASKDSEGHSKSSGSSVSSVPIKRTDNPMSLRTPRRRSHSIS